EVRTNTCSLFGPAAQRPRASAGFGDNGCRPKPVPLFGRGPDTLDHPMSGGLNFVLSSNDLRAAGDCQSKIRIEPDRLIVVCDRRFVLLFLEICVAAVAEGDSILRIEPDRLVVVA